MKQKKDDITILINPRSKFLTQYGRVSGREWLQQEVERINADPGRTVALEERNGKVVLVPLRGDPYYGHVSSFCRR